MELTKKQIKQLLKFTNKKSNKVEAENISYYAHDATENISYYAHEDRFLSTNGKVAFFTKNKNPKKNHDTDTNTNTDTLISALALKHAEQTLSKNNDSFDLESDNFRQLTKIIDKKNDSENFKDKVLNIDLLPKFENAEIKETVYVSIKNLKKIIDCMILDNKPLVKISLLKNYGPVIFENETSKAITVPITNSKY